MPASRSWKRDSNDLSCARSSSALRFDAELPLSPSSETHDYIQARLHVAGANGKPVFASPAMDAVHFYSRGIPRVINLLCEHALIHAYTDQVQPVPAHIVAEIAHEFQFDDVKPFAPPISFEDSLNANLIAMQSVLARTPVHPPVAAGPANEPATPVPGCDRTSGFQGVNEAFGHSGAQTPPLAVPMARRINARQPWELPMFLSDSSQLIAELAKEEGPLTLSPLLQVVEAKGKFGVLPGSSRCPVSSPQKPVHLRATVNPTKATPLIFRWMTLPALRLSWARWSARWRDRFSPAVTSLAWAQKTPILLRQLKRSLPPIRSCYQRCLAWGDRCLTIVGSIDWLRITASAYQWFLQPWNPTQWPLLDSRLFEARRRLNHKKM